MRRVAPPASEDDSSGSGVPGWLEALLGTRFFLACAAHPGSPRNECNMFCIDCRATPAAFCYYCRSHRHTSHRVIQIRRSSYHDVVRVTEVEDVLDIAGVQTYVINSARVLFLNERPQPRGAGAAAGKAAASPYNCEICGRALLDPFRFCSLGCKVHLPFFSALPAQDKLHDFPSFNHSFLFGTMPMPFVRLVRSRLIRFSSVTRSRMQLVDTKTHGHGHGHGATVVGNVDGGGGSGSEAEAGGSKNGARPQGRRRKGTPHRAPFGS
ncbi:hypothetical protein CFC21_109223 [Triticum aestivum]|uniref:PLATZ transcription factor family protein n=2 Tax=Triticum aestivum TaxID=4565 RepID=A0A9R1NCK5_WHEAT|nr:hypothetical protein CFC21_109223 [Triticum aestivum]